MMRVILLMLAAFMILPGCSWFPSGESAYKEARSIPPLRTTDEVSLPPRDSRYAIPGVDDLADLATAASLSAKRVSLPKDSVILREKDGLHWLEISEPAEQVWNLLVAYWMEQKVPLIESDPRKGVIRTDWIPRKTAGSKKVVRDQYRMRLERAGEGSRVYVSHFATGSNSARKDGADWTLLPSDDDRKNRILSEVAAFLVSDVSS